MNSRIPFGRLFAACFFSLAVLGIVGCGGVKDPTEVALKPNEETPSGGNGTGGGDGGGTQNGSSKPPAGGYGDITGKIVLASGDSIPEPKIKIAKGAAAVNREFCAAENAILDNSLVVDSGSRGVANVFIYLSKAPSGAKAPESSGEPAIFDQVGCTFVPHSMVMLTKKEIIVKSQDPVPHNVHTLPTRSDAFNKVIDPSNKEGIPLTYEKPESIPCAVICDFHKWMKAYHLPLDHPYAAVTDKEGNFTIKGLPSGTHKFVIWHEGKGYLERGKEFTVTADKEENVGEISFGLNRLAQGDFRGPKPRVVNISVAKN